MPIEIEDLREAVEDGGDHIGYFARGHLDKSEFARACNEYSGAVNYTDRRHVAIRHVRYVWWRTGQMEGEPQGTMCFHCASPGAKGAWKATVAEPEDEWFRKQAAMRQREYERGKRAGYEAALGWLLMTVEFGHGRPMDSEAMKQRRALVEDIRRAFSADAIDKAELHRREVEIS